MNTPVFLIWIATLSTSGGWIEKKYVMPNMETCLKATQAAQIKVPSGGDAETTVSLFCATKIYNN